MKESLYKYINPPSGFSFFYCFKQVFVCLLILFVQLWPCSATEAGQNTLQYIKGIRTDGHVEFINSEGKIIASISVEIADTPEALRKGLMWRTGMDDTMGMLFIFENADSKAFWMKNTLTPLDIIFVSESGGVINIAANTKPMSTTRYKSNGPVKYVVEVIAGFCARHGVVEGTVINIK